MMYSVLPSAIAISFKRTNLPSVDPPAAAGTNNSKVVSALTVTAIKRDDPADRKNICASSNSLPFCLNAILA